MLNVNSFEKRYEDFKLVMDRELERCPWIKIKQLDLVFFPLCHKRHFFFLCYNLRDDELEIIDNMLLKTTFKAAYRDFPQLYCDYRATMYIILENLRNMARPKRISSATGGVSRKDNVNEYERQRELNIQLNNRKLQELGIQRTMQPTRRTNGSIQLCGEQNCEEDDKYCPTEDERV
ncbi:hypothetical protein Cgig2_029014 [Carnegiea gigantea]|uniref:Ubiquitin-like protease family profile domain-containing protein n=1 Tax=Carnegiea gigantea TaxID=171969 RepID=A0A9Q1JW59_9CARY|nr:hypothetical protein Cgig2_029014 [Carnegiea gigantea]